MNRIDIGELQPQVYRSLAKLDREISSAGIDPLHLELIKIRASQINKCAYCLDLHVTRAKQLGETDRRIHLLPVWQDVNVFTMEEKLMLQLTEEITMISSRGLSENLYQQAVAEFGEEMTAHLILAVVSINAWNRISVASQHQVA